MQSLQTLKNVTGLKPGGIVGVHIGQPNGSVPVNDLGAGYRQLPGVIAVVFGQLDTHFFKGRLKLVNKAEGQSELSGDAIADIAEHLKLERVLFGNRQGVVRGLGRDGDQGCALRLHFGQTLLIGLQLQVAVRSPRASIKGNDCRSFGQEVG